MSLRTLPKLRLRPGLSSIRQLSYLRTTRQTLTPAPKPTPATRPAISSPITLTANAGTRTPSLGKRVLSTTSTGKAEGDLIVEELQDLYEIAKDEFEIATDSTDGGTIYAASDRESARDALNQLLGVYSLYTMDLSSGEGQAKVKEHEEAQAQAQEGDEEGQGQFVTTNFDPREVRDEVREEVKKRVGQRVRELRNAVELLEERALGD